MNELQKLEPFPDYHDDVPATIGQLNGLVDVINAMGAVINVFTKQVEFTNAAIKGFGDKLQEIDATITEMINEDDETDGVIKDTEEVPSE